jgi:hypothetical protein
MMFIYRLLLQLHPVRFRRRFAEEMLLMFDEAPRKTWLIVDGVGSMARQWLLRSGLWKWLLAGLGGLFSLMPLLTVSPSSAPSQLDSVRLDSPVGFIMLIALGSVLAVSFTLILAITWFRFAGRRRA